MREGEINSMKNYNFLLVLGKDKLELYVIRDFDHYGSRFIALKFPFSTSQQLELDHKNDCSILVS